MLRILSLILVAFGPSCGSSSGTSVLAAFAITFASSSDAVSMATRFSSTVFGESTNTFSFYSKFLYIFSVRKIFLKYYFCPYNKSKLSFLFQSHEYVILYLWIRMCVSRRWEPCLDRNTCVTSNLMKYSQLKRTWIIKSVVSKWKQGSNAIYEVRRAGGRVSE